MNDQRIRKGDFCAVAERQPSGSLSGPGYEWTYTIGKVAHAAQKGTKIAAARVYRWGTSIRLREDDQPRWWQSYAIRGAEMQAIAARFLGHEWPTIEAMRADLLGARQ